MTEQDPWPAILKQALDEAIQQAPGPVPGARLQPIVRRCAEAAGQQLPPETEPELRFAQLLDRYPSVVVTLRTRGSDILVAPASEPGLLARPRSGGRVGIRKDLFTAFTQISTGKNAWYVPGRDTIIWLPTDKPGPEDSVLIPRATLQHESDVRRNFANSQDATEIREILLSALSASNPLSAFTVGVRSHHLQREWHEFRAAELIERLKHWAEANHVDWVDNWLTSSSQPRIIDVGVAVSSTQLDGVPSEQAELLTAFQRLDPADLSRISVPLDIVLKLLARGQ